MAEFDIMDWLIWDKKALRILHEKNEFVKNKTHINGIESFWDYAKTRLSKFRGIRKEYGFKFNYRHENIYQMFLKIFRNNPLF